MNQPFGMNTLQSAQQLFNEHQNRLERKRLVAKVKEILDRRSEQIHRQVVDAQNVVLAEFAQMRKTIFRSEDFVDVAFEF